MKRLSPTAERILSHATRPSNLLERLLGDRRRRNALRTLAALGEIQAVPGLLPLVVEDKLRAETAATITAVFREVTPSALAWIDEAARGSMLRYYTNSWWSLQPEAVPRLAGLMRGHPVVVGLLACHPDGHVREAAVIELSRLHDGSEIPFLALRANDWVQPVAARAGAALADRIVPTNLAAIGARLPFLFRMLGARRHDPHTFETRLQSVLSSDGGAAALSSVGRFTFPVRRFVFRLLTPAQTSILSPALVAALEDADCLIRLHAIRRLGSISDRAAAVAWLRDVAMRDGVAMVRRQALQELADLHPEDIGQLVTDRLLDRAPMVRQLARTLISRLDLGIVARQIYLNELTSDAPNRLPAAIAGFAELGPEDGLAVIEPFLRHPVAPVRGSALRAVTMLAPDQGMRLAVEALTETASLVRSVAIRLLGAHVSKVDFRAVRSRGQQLASPQERVRVLRILARAPKWDAVSFVLESLDDPDAAVRDRGARLLGSWLARFNSNGRQPDREQLIMARGLLEQRAGVLSSETEKVLRFTLGSFEPR